MRIVRVSLIVAMIAILVQLTPARAQEPGDAAPAPATQPAGGGRLPFIHIDMKKRQVRVDCEEIDCPNPLEFFCVVAGTNEHESVLRTRARPANIHLALLMLGLQPGEPVHYSQATKKWYPPHGPPLNISCEFEKDGKKVVMPAYRMMRDMSTHKTMPPLTWIFVGSRIMPDGNYAADVTGYVVSVVNFDLTLIDIPDLASSANETLEWEINPEVLPKKGAPVMMIIEPAGDVEHGAATTQPRQSDLHAPATAPANPQSNTAPDLRSNGSPASSGAANSAAGDPPATSAAATTQPLSDVHIDQAKVDRMIALWNQKVAPHDAALREAAQAQYETITQLRAEQQRLINEADRIQRTIDQLEKKYQDMTTPRPETAGQ